MKPTKWLLIGLLLLPIVHAQTPPMPLELIELLGEFDEDDSESLQTVLDDVKASQTNKANHKMSFIESQGGQNSLLPQEIKK